MWVCSHSRLAASTLRPAGSDSGRLARPTRIFLEGGAVSAVAPSRPKPGGFHLVSCLAGLCNLICWLLPAELARPPPFPAPTLCTNGKVIWREKSGLADWAPLAPLPPFAGLSHTVQSPTTPVHNPRPTFCSSSDVLTVTPSSCPRQNTEIVECASRIAQAVMDSLRLYRGPGPPQVEQVRVKPPSTSSFQSTKLIQTQHGRCWLVSRQSLSHWHWHIKHIP
jgi:hypothetical protein